MAHFYNKSIAFNVKKPYLCQGCRNKRGALLIQTDMTQNSKGRRGHPPVPDEEKRVTISCRIHPSTKAYLREKRLRPGRILDKAIERLREIGDL